MPSSTYRNRKRIERDFAKIENAVDRLGFEYWKPPQTRLTKKQIHDYNVWIREVCKGLKKTHPKVQADGRGPVPRSGGRATGSASHNLKASKRKQ
jgi:hypothetical protein